MRSVVILLLVSAVFFLVMCGRDRNEGAEFRGTLTIAPGNYLFIYGHEFHGDVVCALEPGDSVRVGGLPVYPRRLPPPRVFSEEELREVFDKVPFILDRVREGQTWNQASEAYWQRVGAMEQSAERAYRREVGSTGSHDRGVKAALDSLDWSLLDSTKVNGREITLWKKGLLGSSSFHVTAAPPARPSVKQPQVATPQKAREILQHLSRTVGPGARGVSMEVLTHGDTILAGGAVAEALTQIEEAQSGNPASGPLSAYELEGILVAKRGVAK